MRKTHASILGDEICGGGFKVALNILHHLKIDTNLGVFRLYCCSGNLFRHENNKNVFT